MKNIFFYFLALAISLNPTELFATDIDTLRANVTTYLTAAGTDTTDPIVAQALADLETSARSYMTSCLPRGGWPDINYAAALAVSPWPAHTHYLRMMQMARAYNTPGQGLYQSDSVKNALELALDSIHDLVYSGISRINNWWYWYQGIPMYYGPTLLLMEGKVDSAIFSQAVATLKWCLDYPSPASNPGDMVTQSLGNLYYGIVAGDTLYLNKARTLARGDLRIYL